ncbi:hypothetical protein [Dyadobacter chenhuakuii]|uniref:Uncharacterized protein n=1 Tax=Dyadobacter chenhuakuii TaxID=2909339 RepID=A0A9X1QDC1_9BACT|nr:hypothetical protein [Dyadobacter chenhuakuii]MCF2498387.1 hypothetical protein [Dyadobacter chenhuakuii]
MANKTNPASMEPAAREQLTVDHFSLNFSVVGRDTTGGAEKPLQFQESVNLNFSNEAELNKTLLEKPFLMDLIPKLVKVAVDKYDPANENAKKLKEEIIALLD